MNNEPPLHYPSGNHKIWAILSHLSGFLGLWLLLPLVVYFAMRHESRYVANNARHALNFHLSALVYILCCIPLSFVGVGEILIVVVAVGVVVLSIVAAIRASRFEIYRYPFCIEFIKGRHL
ncbi:hypothetical protein GALL_325500 [mine drainage metagenome]|uniref:DUF4870 domain-containing protein n=1 Tax=mine drainage metagenome TaxID=410659 RepID=A0A1J5RBU4_9ZZZZ